MNKFELNPTIQEIINIKYVEVLMDKLYKEELITTKEHELLILQCEKELKKKIKEWEALNGNKNITMNQLMIKLLEFGLLKEMKKDE